MTLEMWIVLGILVTAVILFITEWLRVDIVALGVVVALMLTGVLSTAEALSGFSNAAVLTIAALFIVGGAVLRTGLASMIGRRILLIAGGGELRLIVVLMVAVALLSSFMSDTGTVAVLLPAVIILARDANINPSKLLIPLAFGALLGGATTLIGTPPNLIVSDLLREEGLQPFTFFSYTPMGLVLVVVGVVFMALAGRYLLPQRKVEVTTQPMPTPQELIDLYQLPNNLFRLRVRRTSPLVGETISSARLGEKYQISVLDILRRVEPRPTLRLVKGRGQADGETAGVERVSIVPEAETNVQVDDVLLVRGEPKEIGYAAGVWNLALQPAEASDDASLVNDEIGVAEILIPPRSTLIGKSIVDMRFSRRYGLTVLGINRAGQHEQADIKEMKLRAGDLLFVQGAWKNIMALREQPRDFIVTGQPEAMIGGRRRDKAVLALLVLAGMVLLMITNVTSVATAAMLAGLLMVLTGCVTMDEAYESIDWKSVVLVAGMLPMSIALEQVGLVNVAAQGLVDGLGGVGTLAVMAGLFLLTSLFTQVLSNTATTVVVAPIALAAARTLGIAPYAYLMAVAIAASMAFASPVASPVNTLVMGAGNYRFSDYMKVGLPLILLTLLASVLVLPLLFPF